MRWDVVPRNLWGEMAVVSTKNGRGRPITRSVFRNLFLSMIVFGLAVGAGFPLIARLFLGSERALSPGFVALCMLAGFLVGLANYSLFDYVVSRELATVAQGMEGVLQAVTAAESTQEGFGEQYELPVSSNDAIGKIQTAFNDMTEAIDRRLNFEHVTRSLTIDLSATVEPGDASRMILKGLADVCSANAGLLYGDSDGAYSLLASYGIDGARDIPSRLDQLSEGLAEELGQGRIVVRAAEDRATGPLARMVLSHTRAARILFVPLLSKQHPAGVAVIASSVKELSQQQIEILQSLQDQAGPSLQNALLHRRISILAAVDDLTRVLNRRFGLRRLREEYSRSVRQGSPLSVLMLDIDHFKSVNDSLGHDAGDRVLRRVAATIEGNLRTSDIVCRYGGEEFMVVAPGSNLLDGLRVAERLRRVVQADQIEMSEEVVRITVTVGVATWPISQVSASEQLVTAADKAMYLGKNMGRNAVAAIVDGQPVGIEYLDGVTGCAATASDG